MTAVEARCAQLDELLSQQADDEARLIALDGFLAVQEREQHGLDERNANLDRVLGIDPTSL